MRESRELADLHIGVSAESQLLMRFADQFFYLGLSHAVPERLVSRLVSRKRDVRG